MAHSNATLANCSASNLTSVMQSLGEEQAHQHLRHGQALPLVYGAWMVLLVLAVLASLRFLIEDLAQASKVAARAKAVRTDRETEAAQKADAAERGAATTLRDYFEADLPGVEVVVHWTRDAQGVLVEGARQEFVLGLPKLRSRSGTGSPVSPV